MRLRILYLLSLLATVAPLSQAKCGDIVISGTVTDKSGKKVLESANLAVQGTNIGTVSNSDGYFRLTIPDTLKAVAIKAWQTGYRSSVVRIDKSSYANKKLSIRLEPAGKVLNEITVYGADPRGLVEQALNRIPENYSATQDLYSSFYRETIRKGNRYIGVSEAIVNVMKKPYKVRDIYGERVQIVKGRRLMSQKSSDTLAVKIVGGPTLPVLLDVVKNKDILFSAEELNFYDFKLEPMGSIDNRGQYVVSFRPKVKVDYVLNRGRVYIDCETLSFTRAEFSLDDSDKDKVTRAILRKKPAGLRFKPQEVDFVVTYKYQDGKSYINYIRSKTRFKCDWKRRLFSSGYTAYAEMVMVDRDNNPDSRISRKEAFGKNDIFYDMVDNFKDKDFWKDYNIIEPTESLEKAVLKINR